MRETAALFKALSEETRLRILAILTQGEICVCDLMEVLDLPQSTVSRHLGTLRNAGLVGDQRRGVWIYYRLLEHSEPVNRELLNILRGDIGHLDQVQVDREKLQALLERKEQDSC